MGVRIIRYKPLPEMWACLIAEFIGTFFLVMTISMCLQQSQVVGALGPIGIGFVLCSYIFAYGYISGAIYNPAVSVALVMIQLMEIRKAILYTISQLLGGFCGALLSWYLVGINDAFKAPAPQTSQSADVARSAVAEFVFTFGLINIIFNVACSRQRDNQHYGLAIGCYIIAAAFCVGGISGGSFNPAVATSLQVVNCMVNKCHDIQYLWLYWLCPILAAIFSSLIFALMHPVNVDEVMAPSEEASLLAKHQGVAEVSGNTPRASAQQTRFSVQETRMSYGIQAPNRNQNYFGVVNRPARRETDESLHSAFGTNGDSTQAYMGPRSSR